VIGTRAGGLPEVVRDNETGFLCPVGDIDGMSAAALGVLRDQERWNAMSTLAARDARERFNLESIVGLYESFYEYALSLPSTTQRAERETTSPKTT
jgi:glycosyltransferase involved in cell wall biosynthesis